MKTTLDCAGRRFSDGSPPPPAGIRSARPGKARLRARTRVLDAATGGRSRISSAGDQRRVFSDPDSAEDAIAFIDALLDSPGVDLRDCAKEWPLLRNKLLTLGLRGSLVTDTWIAATVEMLGEHLVTFDHDFERLLPARDLTLLPPAS